METIQDITHFKAFPFETAVTLGTFDGVHLGHRKIIERLINTAKNRGLTSVALTFFPHPGMVLQKNGEVKLLNTLAERVELLELSGLDYLVVYPFTREFSRLSAAAFVRDILVKQLHAKKIIIGYDHRFGRNRDAGIEELRVFGHTFNFEVEEIPAQEVDAVAVSSTKIRKALLEGDMATANRYLSYPYRLTGKVIRGKGLGKQLGFHTANLYIAETYKLLPKDGVYVVKGILNGKRYFGMMNIGFKPTVTTGTERMIEVHFFEFCGNLYDKTIQIEVLHRLRKEHKFTAIEELQAQLKKDKEHSLAFLSL